MRVRVFSREIEGQNGYDVEILSPQATVQDYLDGLNQLIEEGELSRLRCQVKICEGCDLCCSERIPLTSIDIFQIRQNKLISGNSLSEVINQCADVEVEPPWVDITLKIAKNSGCLFLNEQNKRCKNYAHRPLVCQTFICCPATERAQSLRSAIVNTGEDELVRLWLIEGLLTGEMPVSTGEMKKIDLIDWEESVFTGKQEYNQILLKDLCPQRLWIELTPGYSHGHSSMV